MRKSVILVLLACFAAFGAVSKTLDIYVIDVEGGNATLFVSPSGESLLIDTGNGGPAAARDVGRIMAAMKDAGVQQLDHLITTHWHGDHFGGMAELASKVTIKEFIDHGGNVQPAQQADDFLKTTYLSSMRNPGTRSQSPATRLRSPVWIGELWSPQANTSCRLYPVRASPIRIARRTRLRTWISRKTRSQSEAM